LNPNFALDRGIRRRMPDIFFLKKFVHATSMAFTFCVETASAFFVSVLASNAKSGLNAVILQNTKDFVETRNSPTAEISNSVQRHPPLRGKGCAVYFCHFFSRLHGFPWVFLFAFGWFFLPLKAL